MKSKDLNAICKKYGCFMDMFDRIYILKDEKWIKLGRIYYKIKNDYYYPQTLEGKNLGGDKDFEPCLIALLKYNGYT